MIFFDSYLLFKLPACFSFSGAKQQQVSDIANRNIFQTKIKNESDCIFDSFLSRTRTAHYTRQALYILNAHELLLFLRDLLIFLCMLQPINSMFYSAVGARETLARRLSVLYVFLQWSWNRISWGMKYLSYIPRATFEHPESSALSAFQAQNKHLLVINFMLHERSVLVCKFSCFNAMEIIQKLYSHMTHKAALEYNSWSLLLRGFRVMKEWTEI